MQYPMVKLGDVCKIVAGQSPESQFYTNDSSFTEFHQGSKKFGKREIYNSGIYTKQETKIAESGSLLISVRAPVGDLNFTPRRICIGRGLAAITPSTKIDKNFLYYFLISATKKINDKASAGTCFNSISSTQLFSFDIPLPPLPIQQEIVARLEKELAKVDEMADAFKRMAELADEEFKSVLSEIFEHVEGKKVKLGDIADVYDGDHQPPPQVEEGIPFLVISNVADGRLNFENTRKVPRQYYDSLSLNRKPQLNDLLLTVTGSYGIPVKVDVKREFCFQRHIALIRTTKLQLDFLFYFMKSKKSQQYFDKVATGTAQKTVSLSALRNMPIIYPKDEIQLSISKYADSTYKNYLIKKDYIYKGISLCSELRKSILQEAFS